MGRGIHRSMLNRTRGRLDIRLDARIWDWGDTRNLAETCAAIHAEDALAAIELWHGGANAFGRDTRLPPRGVSQVATLRDPTQSCATLSKSDIQEVLDSYVRAARMAREAGFDIITVFMTHADGLPYQFLLPFFNRRDDEYGGSFQNRARFGVEVLERVREAVGKDCAISARFGIDSLDRPEGLGFKGVRATDEGGDFIELCDDLVDFWDVNVGSPEWGEDAASSRSHAENHEATYVEDG